MPSKKSKKSKGSTTKGTENTDTEASKAARYAELIAQDPNFFVGTANFTFPNGDEYDGEYCAHANGLVWRQGKGTYKTKDGQIYIGDWDGDKLVENSNVEIIYADGTKYLGNLVKNHYTGPGIYKLEENVSVVCNFMENKPTGDVTLIDPNGKVWHGFAEKDDSLLIKEHAFYQSIGKDLGKGRSKAKPIQKEYSKTSVRSSKKSSSRTSLKYKDLRDMEKEVFAKSKKTPSNLDLENSDWYQDYETYCKNYAGIVRKAKLEGKGDLSASECEWYENYEKFEKKYLGILEDYKNNVKKENNQGNVDLFKLIHSQKYKADNHPKPVFFPKQESDEGDCDSTCVC